MTVYLHILHLIELNVLYNHNISYNGNMYMKYTPNPLLKHFSLFLLKHNVQGRVCKEQSSNGNISEDVWGIRSLK